MTWGSTEDPSNDDDGGFAFGLLMLAYVLVFVVLPVVSAVECR